MFHQGVLIELRWNPHQKKTTAEFSFVEPNVPNILLISSSVNTATESFLAATVFIMDPALIFGIFLFNSVSLSAKSLFT